MTTFHSHNIDNERIPPELQNGVVAIGNFDGLHLGHRTIVDKTLAIARDNNCPSILLCFDPHPRTWFNPENPVYLLTPPDMKSSLAAGLGISAMAMHTFNDAFSSLSADDFIVKILIEKLRARHVVTGEDFHFGKKRQGTPEFLMKAGKAHDFSVTLMPPCRDESGKVISSSRIRKHLENGKLSKANELLGYPYQINGTVITGQKIGRTLGFPTANLELPANVRLRHGVYAVRVIRENGDRFDGVASFGRRPTFDNGKVLFETYLFDFDENLYGEEITIELHEWQRDEEKFDNAEELVEQMMIDKKLARQFFSNLNQNS